MTSVLFPERQRSIERPEPAVTDHDSPMPEPDDEIGGWADGEFDGWTARDFDEPSEHERRPRRWVKPVALVAIVAVIAAWSYALWFSLSRDDPEPLDAASRQSVISVCTAATNELARLPAVSSSDDIAFGALVIRAENEIFLAMISALGNVNPPDADGSLALGAFVVDWRALIDARANWAASLERGEPTNLVVPADERGRPITVRMNEYSGIQGVGVCSPITLDAELVGGQRELVEGLASANAKSANAKSANTKSANTKSANAMSPSALSAGLGSVDLSA